MPFSKALVYSKHCLSQNLNLASQLLGYLHLNIWDYIYWNINKLLYRFYES